MKHQKSLPFHLTATVCIILCILLGIVKCTNSKNTNDNHSIQRATLKRNILQMIIENGRKLMDKKPTSHTMKHNHTQTEPRTFGRPIKKLQAMLIPFMFKFGIMWMMILITMFLALKGVAIGTLILIINLVTIVAKLVAWKYELKDQSHHYHQPPPQPYYGWGPPQQKNIHLHIHGGGVEKEVHHEPYGAYSQSRPTYEAPSHPPVPDWEPQKYPNYGHRVITL